MRAASSSARSRRADVADAIAAAAEVEIDRRTDHARRAAQGARRGRGAGAAPSRRDRDRHRRGRRRVAPRHTRTSLDERPWATPGASSRRPVEMSHPPEMMTFDPRSRETAGERVFHRPGDDKTVCPQRNRSIDPQPACEQMAPGAGLREPGLNSRRRAARSAEAGEAPLAASANGSGEAQWAGREIERGSGARSGAPRGAGTCPAPQPRSGGVAARGDDALARRHQRRDRGRASTPPTSTSPRTRTSSTRSSRSTVRASRSTRSPSPTSCAAPICSTSSAAVRRCSACRRRRRRRPTRPTTRTSSTSSRCSVASSPSPARSRRWATTTPAR